MRLEWYQDQLSNSMHTDNRIKTNTSMDEPTELRKFITDQAKNCSPCIIGPFLLEELESSRNAGLVAD
jgi:hypothetical protein